MRVLSAQCGATSVAGRAVLKAIRILRLLIYPWALWSLSRWLAERAGGGARPLIRIALRACVFGLVGVPLIVVLSAELLVQGNTLLIGEFSDAYLRSDFDTGFAGPLRIPGSPYDVSGRAGSRDELLQVSATVGPPLARTENPDHAWLVRRHAPVLIQRIGSHPRWDIPVHIDFDGNADPRDNARNAADVRRLRPGIYGEVTAETTHEYYVSYSIYHIRDYDHPIRAMASAEAEHDNDNEGVMLRVTKSDMQVSEIMTWYHNRYFHCARRPDSQGSERVMARAHFESGTHPILFVQAMGHGVRCAQSIDLEEPRGLKIFRHRGAQPVTFPRLDASREVDLLYDIDSLDDWYRQSSGPFDSANMFEGTIEIGRTPSGERIRIGRFIAGEYAGNDSWARPKPMWSWDDAWDDLPIFVAHYFPSLAFRSHLGVETSSHYIEHRAAELSFGLSPQVLSRSIDVEVERSGEAKWSRSHFESDARQLRNAQFYRAAKALFKRYADYLFQALG